jgi:hypothetical protein
VVRVAINSSFDNQLLPLGLPILALTVRSRAARVSRSGSAGATRMAPFCTLAKSNWRWALELDRKIAMRTAVRNFAAAGRRRHWLALAILAAASGIGRAQAMGPWTIVVKTTCEAMSPAYCQGAYGFEIASDGAFTAGPSASGRRIEGRLDLASLTNLTRATERVLADPDARETPCSPIHGIPGVSETVSIAAAGRTLALRGAPGALDPRCVSGNVADLEALFSAAHQAMSRHYPSPFE